MSKREHIEPHKGDKRYVRRGAKGQFKESDDVGASLTRDRRRKAKTVAPKGRATAATGSAPSPLGPRRIHQVFAYILERRVPRQTVACSAAKLGIDQDNSKPGARSPL